MKKFNKWSFDNKGFLAIILFVLLAVLGGCLSKNNKEKDTTTEIKSSVPSISIDSLSTLGIDVTLWAESKESFEKLNNVKTERVAWSIHSFIASMAGSMGEFDWAATKQYMKWQGNKTELFSNYGNRFVVVGTYATLQDRLIFSGYLYKY